MGIKFRCPNGHKLHVKSFLAGKRGICPHCGIKVQIPANATDQADDKADDAEALDIGGAAGGVATLAVGTAAKSMADTVTIPSPAPQPATSSPTVKPLASAVTPVVKAAPVSATPVQVTPVKVAPVAVEHGIDLAGLNPITPVTVTAPVVVAATPSVASAPVGVPAPAATVDAILEAPNAVWYVRPPSGGQFGPARGDIMRKWLGEGRVSHDSLVWRDGWADWKQASSVFPQLSPTGAPVPAAPAVGPVVGFPDSKSNQAAARVIRAKKRSNGLAIATVITLGLVALVLMVVLFVLVIGGLNAN